MIGVSETKQAIPLPCQFEFQCPFRVNAGAFEVLYSADYNYIS